MLRRRDATAGNSLRPHELDCEAVGVAQIRRLATHIVPVLDGRNVTGTLEPVLRRSSGHALDVVHQECEVREPDIARTKAGDRCWCWSEILQEFDAMPWCADIRNLGHSARYAYDAGHGLRGRDMRLRGAEAEAIA